MVKDSVFVDIEPYLRCFGFTGYSHCCSVPAILTNNAPEAKFCNHKIKSTLP